MEAILVGSKVQIKYKEPTLNELDDAGIATPLTDLGKTSIKFQVQGDAAATNAHDVPASSVTGGGSIDQVIDVPLSGKREANVDFFATASDISGNESAPSTKITLRIDRLAPAAPI